MNETFNPEVDFIPDAGVDNRKKFNPEEDFIPDQKPATLPPSRYALPGSTPLTSDVGRLMEPMVTLPRIESVNHPNLAALYNVGKSIPEFMTSPVGLASIPVSGGVLGQIGKRVLAGGFGASVASSIPEQARQAGEMSVTGTPQQKAEANVGLGLSTALVPLLAAGAMAKGKTAPPPVQPEPVLQRPLTSSFLEQQRLAKIAQEQPQTVVEKPVMDVKETEKVEARQPTPIIQPMEQPPIVQQPKPLYSAVEKALGEPLQRAENLVANDAVEKYGEDTGKNAQKRMEDAVLKANQAKIDEEMGILEAKMQQQRADALEKVYQKVSEPRPELMKGGKLETRPSVKEMDSLEQQRIREKDLRPSQLPNEVLAQQRAEELGKPKLDRIIDPEYVEPSIPKLTPEEKAILKRQAQLNRGGKIRGKGGNLPEMEEPPRYPVSAEQKLINLQEPPITADVHEPPASKPLKSLNELIDEQLKRQEMFEAVDEVGKRQVEISPEKIDEGLVRKKVPLKAGERTIFNELWDKEVGKHQKPEGEKQGTIGEGINKALEKSGEEGSISIQGIKDTWDKLRSGDWNLPVISSDIQRLDVGSKADRYAGKQFRKYFVGFKNNKGKYEDRVVREIEANINPKDREIIRQYAWEKDHGMATKPGSPPIVLTPEQKAMYDQGSKFLVDVKNDATSSGILVNGRAGKVRSGYFPDIMDPKIAEELNTLSDNNVRKIKIVDEWAKHIERESGGKVSIKDAREMVRDSITNGLYKAPGSHFKGLRTAEGYGLPYSLVDKRFDTSLRTYAKRVASDMAYFNHIENDPVMRRLLNIPDQTGSMVKNPKTYPGTAEEIGVPRKDLVTNLMELVGGSHNKTVLALDRWRSLVTSQYVQGQSGLFDMANSFVAPLRFLTWGQSRMLVKGWKDLQKGIKDARRRGVLTDSTVTYEGLQGAFDSAAEGMKKAVELSNILTGRRGMDIGSRAALQNIGELLAQVNILAGAKDARYLKPLENLAKFHAIDDAEWRPYIGKTFPKDVVERFGAAMVEKGQSTYDPLTAPNFVLNPNNYLAPVFKLAQWALGQSNLLMDDVVKPALKGDIGPLLKTTLSGIMAYEMIETIRKMLSGNRSVPTPKEAFVLGKQRTWDKYKEGNEEEAINNIPEALRNELFAVINAINLAGVTGFLGSTASTFVQMFGQGQKMEWLRNPATSFVNDIMIEAVNASTAVRAGEPAFPVTMAFIKNAFVKNMQTAKVINYLTMTKDEKLKRDMAMDWNKYQLMTGERLKDYDPQANRYFGLAEKEFKKEQDLTKVPAELMSAVEKIDEQSKGDVRIKNQKMESLKNIPSYPMPDPTKKITESDEVEKFIGYMKYLKEAKGEDTAMKYFEAYMKDKQNTKLKRKMVDMLTGKSEE